MSTIHLIDGMIRHCTETAEVLAGAWGERKHAFAIGIDRHSAKDIGASVPVRSEIAWEGGYMRVERCQDWKWVHCDGTAAGGDAGGQERARVLRGQGEKSRALGMWHGVLELGERTGEGAEWCTRGHQKYPCTSVRVRAASVQVVHGPSDFCTDMHGRARTRTDAKNFNCLNGSYCHI